MFPAGGDTVINCHANANSINDDHADKSTNFEACKRHFQRFLTFTSYSGDKQSRLFRVFDGWNVHFWIRRGELDIFLPIQALEKQETKCRK